jgi:bile acid:Na+ symporter, BASS family
MNAQFASMLPYALAVVMLSLGLSLTVADFTRAARHPKAMAVALSCQALLLPAASFALAWTLGLPPELAIGLVLLAASPGGTLANLYSHLAHGDLALNITLTAVNSLLSIITLPLTLAAAMYVFMDHGTWIPPQFGKVLQVIGIVLVPVFIGMALRRGWPALARRAERPVRALAAAVLLLAAALSIAASWQMLAIHWKSIGAAVLLFNLMSLAVGYGAPALAGLGRPQRVAISMEIGLHNGALALAIALSPALLNNPVMAAPAAIYSVLSLFTAAAFLAVLSRSNPLPAAAAASIQGEH